MKKINAELKQLDVQALELRVEEMRRQLFQLRLQATTQHVKSYSSMKKALKQAVACALTLINQKKSAKGVA